MEHPQSCERTEAMRRLRSVVDFDQYNVYSSVCELQGLARRVSKSTNRLPVIAKDTNDTEIIIRGVSLSLSIRLEMYRTDKTFWRQLFGGGLRQLCCHQLNI